MKKWLAALFLATLLLSACGNGQAGISSGNSNGDQQKQEAPSTDITPEQEMEPSHNRTDEPPEEDAANTKSQDASISNPVLMDQDLGELTTEDWNSLQLSKEQFNQMLTELIEDEEENNPFKEIALLDDRTLKVVFNNSDGESFENLLFAPIFDGVLRNLYMRSSYFQNEQQPVIRFVDGSGKLIAENEDFAEFDQ